jgi:hypothetical protein
LTQKESNENYNPEDFVTTVIEERDIKLKFAIWDQMEFLSEDMKIDNTEEVMDTIRNAVEQYCKEYSPMTESFDEDEN